MINGTGNEQQIPPIAAAEAGGERTAIGNEQQIPLIAAAEAGGGRTAFGNGQQVPSVAAADAAFGSFANETGYTHERAYTDGNEMQWASNLGNIITPNFPPSSVAVTWSTMGNRPHVMAAGYPVARLGSMLSPTQNEINSAMHAYGALPSVTQVEGGQRQSPLYASAGLSNMVFDVRSARMLPAGYGTPLHSTMTYNNNVAMGYGPIHNSSNNANGGAAFSSGPTGGFVSSAVSGSFNAFTHAAGVDSAYNVHQNNGSLGHAQGHYNDITLSASQLASRQVVGKELPIFSGKLEEWPLFIVNYEQSTIRCGFTEHENLIRLQRCLKGAALEAVRGKLMVASTVPHAIETLRMLYGRPDVIHRTLQHKLRNEPAVRPDKLESLVSLALAVQNYRTTIQAIGLADYLNDPMLLQNLVEKLPTDLKLDWARCSLAVQKADIGFFDDWLYKLSICASTVIPLDTFGATSSSEGKGDNRKSKARLMMHDVEVSKGETGALPEKCCHCSGNHKLGSCKSFIALDSTERMRVVREAKRCWRCFGEHYIGQCRARQRCGVNNCTKTHNSLLHDAFQNRQTHSGVNATTETSAASGSEVVLHADGHLKKTLFRYVPVTIHGPAKSMEIFALIDEGSACTLIEGQLAKDLGLEGPSDNLCLKWTGDITHNEVESKRVTLDIAARGASTHRYTLRNVRTICKLELPMQSLDSSALNMFSHLPNLPVSTYKNVCARMIIGLDNIKLSVPLKVEEARDGKLVASKSRLGWAVYGNSCDRYQHAVRVMHICPCSNYHHLDEVVKASFSLEAMGVSVLKEPIQSKDDKRARAIMENSTTYLVEEKRWETGLLWRYDRIELPKSRDMALQRFKCLEARMSRNEDLKEFIHKQMQNYERMGYIRKLHADEVAYGPRSWHLPVFTVFSKNKGKARLVWDAAAKVDGVSLNTVLLTGPDVLPTLIGILMRFREKPVGICGDIRQMFHQIQIRKEDQPAQQFLWRYTSGSGEPDTYVMQVMTFGASCSPALANYIKNRNAQRFESQYPEAVQAILKNTYVDDWLQSVENENDMVEPAIRVRDIHADGGMEMCNWITNSAKVRTALTGCAEQEESFVDVSDSVRTRVLGMWWLPRTDEFAFVQNLDDAVFDKMKKLSKRYILSTIMSMFDPLGLLGFYVVQAKIILQNIWRSGIGWDEPVLEEDCKEWWKWVNILPTIKKLRIPRCLQLVSNANNFELHIFTDASINAYVAVAYLKATSDRTTRCSLVASKTRVAPLRPLSIPRLELLGALLGTRLAKFIEQEMTVAVNRRIFWTDSKNVLFWIRSDARKYHQFVAVRIGEILETTDVAEWKWVPSSENVADDATKWPKNCEFDESTRWFSGPSFLQLGEEKWPITDLATPKDVPERIHHVNIDESLHSSLAVLAPDPSRFSKWEKYRTTQLYVIRGLRSLTRERFPTELKLIASEDSCNSAELVIFRRCQEEAFMDDILCLKRGERLTRKNTLFKLSPYLDGQGLLRVKGRIDAFEGEIIDIKRPIILPSKHLITKLIANFYHRRFHHVQHEVVINEMRQKFCILGLRALLKSAVKECQHCRNAQATPQAPVMGNLPPERLAISAKPFTFTGVDYFGPIEIVVGRRREKRWGVLFTCLTVRAVHLEIAPSLSTDAFLLVFKMFVCRRGVPRKVVSDNGTNFRGASRILMSEIERLSTDKLESEYPEINWMFIPPASPHMGGAWERMVRSAKSILREIVPNTIVPELTLRAALTEIENILNSRPLTYVPLDSIDADVLTPNHFLRGGSSDLSQRVLENGSGAALGKAFRIASQLAAQFRKRWIKECLPHLTRRSKWFDGPRVPIAVGDVVVIVDETSERCSWAKGIIVSVHLSKDGSARSATVKTTKGYMNRPIVKLAKLDVRKE